MKHHVFDGISNYPNFNFDQFPPSRSHNLLIISNYPPILPCTTGTTFLFVKVCALFPASPSHVNENHYLIPEHRLCRVVISQDVGFGTWCDQVKIHCVKLDVTWYVFCNFVVSPNRRFAGGVRVDRNSEGPSLCKTWYNFWQCF